MSTAPRARRPAETTTAARGRGRLPVGDRAQTGSERTRLYRQRQEDARLFEDLKFLSRVNLAAKIAEDLAHIERYQLGEGAAAELIPDLLEGARASLRSSLREVERRCGLKAASRASR